MSAHLRRLLDRQAEALAHLTDAETHRLLRAYDDARRELLEQLRQLASTPRQSFTLQQVRVSLAQLEAGVAQMQQRLGLGLDAAVALQGHRALQDLVELVGGADRAFREVGGPVEVAVLQRIAERHGLLLHRHSLRRYGAELVEGMQRELTVGLARGLTWHQMTERLAGPGGVLDGQRHRAALIVRMEMVRAYGDAAQASLEETAARLDVPGDPDPLLARADEAFDHRNHPFSRALHGKTRTITGEWVVPHAEVMAHAARMKKRVGGIVWERRGDAWVGRRYPAHFADRGRQVPWRESWGA